MAIKIGGKLHSVATGNVVAEADEILDVTVNKKQSQINYELIAAQGQMALDLATKQETINIVTASVDDQVGTPSVVPTWNSQSGTIDLAFHNIKGEQGEQGVQGPKGPQGDSAVWDETTGTIVGMAHVVGQDGTKAMSQKGVMDALDDETVYVDAKWTKAQVEEITSWYAIDYAQTKYVSSKRAKYIANFAAYRGRKIRIVPDGENVAEVAFLTGKPGSASSNLSNARCNVEEWFFEVGTVVEKTVPEDCSYLYITYYLSGHNAQDSIVPLSIEILSDVKEKIGKLETASQTISGDVAQLSDDLDGVEQEMNDKLDDRTRYSDTSWTKEFLDGESLQWVINPETNKFESTSTQSAPYKRGRRIKEFNAYRGKRIRIVANGDNVAHVAFLKNWVSSAGDNASYCSNVYSEGDNSLLQVAAVYETVVPDDCNDLYVAYQYNSASNNDTNTPSSIEIYHDVKDKIRDLEGMAQYAPDIIYLSNNGDDENDGATPSTPKATFAGALNAGSKNMQVVLLSDIYESVDLNNWNGQKQSVTIRGGSNTRTRIVVGWKLEGLVADGTTDVYTYTPAQGEVLPTAEDEIKWLWQHDLEDESTLIEDNYRHPLQRGRRCRSLSTKLVRKDTASEVRSASSDEPCWCVEDNVLYVRVAENSNVITNPIYIPTNTERALEAGDFDLTLSNIECWYGSIYAGDENKKTNYLFKAVDCAARYCTGPGGFVLNDAISSHLERCEADGVTMNKYVGGGITGDGINMHPSLGSSNPYAKGNTHTLIDCWCHDNHDDGYSDHGRSECTIIGGLFEYNRKGGITPSYGSHDNIYHATVVKNKNFGIYVCGDASDGGVGTQAACYGCVAIGNVYNYACLGYNTGGKYKLILNGCISRNPSNASIYAKNNCQIIVRDCTHSGSNAVKKEEGDYAVITIDNGTVIS